MSRRRVAGDRRGFALIAAIWLMVTLMALSFEVATLARTRRLSAANAVEQARAQSAAEAGMEHARARLTYRLDGDVPPPDSMPQADPWRRLDALFPDSMVMGTARYRVTLGDAGAKVNVNSAPVDQLRRLFASVPLDAARADALAEQIADWRDGDDLPRPGGAERAEYLSAGKRALPRNAPLVRVDELRDLYGMTEAIFSQVSPLLTVQGSGLVNLNTASRPVLLSLPGFSERAVAVVLRLRAQGIAISSLEQVAIALGADEGSRLTDASAALLPLITFQSREVEFLSDGWVVGSPVHARTSGLFVRGGGSVFLQGKRSE
jgi:general secretion pathway protein K